MTGLNLLRVQLTPVMSRASLAVIAGLVNLKHLELYGAEFAWSRNGLGELLPLAGRLTNFKFSASPGEKDEPQASAAWVATVARFTKLEYLELRGAGLSDEQLKPLAALTELRTLALGRNPLSGPGLAHFEPLGKLRVLELLGTAVADADAVKRLPGSVMTINLRDTKLTAAALDDLQKSRKWENFFR